MFSFGKIKFFFSDKYKNFFSFESFYLSNVSREIPTDGYEESVQARLNEQLNTYK